VPVCVDIPGGAFRMGDDEGRANERPAHEVWVDAFALARCPVTRREYGVFLHATGHRPPRYWEDVRFTDPEQPAVAVSWLDAVAYCDWLSAELGAVYRLPTEAEREKAARGGNGREYPWGDDLPDWMDPRYRGDDVERPDRVGQDPVNGYGLHNMGDLVHEWCGDWYEADYYAVSPARNPTGPASGQRRASRGGSWRHAIKVTRCAHRSSILPDRQLSDYGFRVTLGAAAAAKPSP
jgi:formylglycine-generating enzyme required for sulfatase activity